MHYNLMDTSFTMCTHAVDMLSPGSLLYQMLCRQPYTYARTGCARYEVDFYAGLCFTAFFPLEEDTALFSEAAVFSGFSAFQWCSPKHITHESGSWSWHCQRVLCGCRALAPTVISVMFWRPPSPLSFTRDETQQTDGKGRLSSEDAFNFHKDDFVS